MVKPMQLGRIKPLLDAESVTPSVSSEDYDWDGGGYAGEASVNDQWKQPCRVATTASVTISTALNAGDTIDGVTLVAGDRVLVKDQSTGSQNGIYIAGTTPERAPDMDEDDEVLGAAVYVIAGSTNAGTVWTVTNTSAVTVDTTAIVWAALSGGSGTTITTKDEGSTLSSTVTTLDFVGAGVTASGAGATTTITIPGGGSLPWFDVTDAAYGAVGDGTTDDTAAINLAIAALNTATKGVLYFPAGTYKTTSALTTITATGLIIGDGIEASAITQSSATAFLFTVSGNGVTFRDLYLDNTATTPSAGAAIRATGGTLNRYENLLISDFWIGIRSEAGLGWAVRGVHVSNCFKYGIHISNSGSPDEGDWTISDTYIVDGLRSSDSAIRIDSSGGGKIVNTKINSSSSTGFNHGIDAALGASAITAVLTIANCSIENVRGDGIKVAVTSTGQFGNISIIGCEIALYSNNSGRAVNLTAASAGGFLTSGGLGNVVIDSCNLVTNGTARAAINLTNTDRVTLGDLQLYGFNARYTSSGDTNTTDGSSPSFATPAIVLGTAAAAGAASTVIRSDSTIVAFDATAPVTQAFGDAAATGSAAFAARRDHVHGMPASPALTAGVLLIADTHSTPIVFADLLQTEAEDDLLYSD